MKAFKVREVWTTRPFCRSITSLPTWFTRLQDENPAKVPRLPVPELPATCTRYLTSIEPLVDATTFKEHQDLVKDFQETQGPKLHALLIERDRKNDQRGGYPYSYIERDWDLMYLGGRYPSPVNVNPAYGLIDDGTPDPFQRATRFTISVVKWISQMKQGNLQLDPGPQCMSGYPKQFGSARIPQLTCDTLRCTPESSHIVVLCNEKFYRVNVISPDGAQVIAPDNLQAQLQYVMDIATSTPAGISLSSCTGDERDTWANLRDDLSTHDQVNAVSLEEIDTALFVLVLDDRVPGTATERSDLSLHGKAANRWFDKLQIMVYPDAHIGVNFEHSFSDGTIWNRWLHEAWHDMLQTESGFPKLPDMPTFKSSEKPRELSWTISSDLQDRIEESHDKLKALASTNTTHFEAYKSVTKRIIKQWKLSPDGVVQMAYQLAYHQLHGSTPPTYESCSTRGFHHGRTETIRSATPAAAAFVNAVASKASKEAQWAAYENAVNTHVDIAKTAAAGQGVDRHLTALNSIASEQDEEKHPFLTDPLRARSTHFQISSSNVTMPFLQYFAFGAVVPDGYGFGYLIKDDATAVNITSYNTCSDTDSKQMGQSLEAAFDHIRSLRE